MTAAAADVSPEDKPRTGTVYAVNSSVIIIGAEKFFLGETKADGIGKGDCVEYRDTGGFLTHLALISKADGTPAAAPPKKATKNTAPADQQPPACVLGECPDKKVHMKFHAQRQRWECDLQGITNTDITNCPQVPKTPPPRQTSSPELDERARQAGFGAPTDSPPKPDPIKVSGIYRGTSKGMVMLTVDGRNNVYSADRALLQYLNSKDCKAKPDQIVTLTLTEKNDGSGSWATAIGPGPEAAPAADQQPPAGTPSAGEQKPPAAAAPASENSITPFQQAPMHVPVEVVQGSSAPLEVLDQKKLDLIKATVAKGCSNEEFELLMHLANRYGLDPLAHQIWAVKYPGDAARIFCGRDGYLEIAHRSKMFDGMESGTKIDDEGKIIGWCKVYRKDMSRPFSVEVSLSEFNTNRNTWSKMPKVMIVKVAESQCLRRAFSISGLYSPEEMDGGA